MFQYAAARSLALRCQVPLLLDPISGFHADIYGRDYELGAFRIFGLLTDSQPTISIGSSLRREYLRWREQLRRRYCGRYFDPSLYSLGIRDLFLFDLYCQSYLYFADIEDLIRRELTFKAVPAGIDDSTTALFAGTNSVCLHARRLLGHTASGLAPKAVVEFYGACGLAYYRRALSKLAQLHGSLRIFVFSDDLGWARRNAGHLSGPHGEAQVVEETDSLRSFFLMTQCRHFVIANSTYSWWAAWSGSYPNKTVCAPSIWNRGEWRLPRDLYPESWTIIDAR